MLLQDSFFLYIQERCLLDQYFFQLRREFFVFAFLFDGNPEKPVIKSGKILAGADYHVLFQKLLIHFSGR